MPIAHLPDTDIHYDVIGSGEPLLLVAGLGGSASYWSPNVEELARHYQVILHDHRGTGGSTRYEGAYSVEMMANDLLGLMDCLGVERAHLVGHSTGGAIGQVLAAIAPERIASLVLYATWMEPDAQMRRCLELRRDIAVRMGAEAYHRATPLFLYPPYFIMDNDAKLAAEIAASVAASTSASILKARTEGIMDFDGRERHAHIACPTLVLVTEDDVLTPLYCSEAIAARIKGAELLTLPRGGHAVSRVEPELFNRIVLDFLSQRPLSGAATFPPVMETSDASV